MKYQQITPKLYIDTEQNRLFAEFEVDKGGKKYVRIIIPIAMWQEEDEYNNELDK